MSTTEHARTTELPREQEHDDREVDASLRLRKSAETIWSYKPFGETDEINLTLNRARHFLVNPTRSGALPSDKEVTHFLQICKIRKLNPWVGDAFLLGYDTRQGAKFETIVAYQALSKRAEAHKAYDGMESGIIVLRNKDEGQELTELEGAFCLPTDELVGAWARVYRKDRDKPATAKILRGPYDKQRSRWEVDPNGMLVKCAKAAAMRDSFPNDLGGMYIAEEKQDDDNDDEQEARSLDNLTAVDLTPTDHIAPDGEILDDAPRLNRKQFLEEVENAPDMTEVSAIRDLTLEQTDDEDEREHINHVCDERVKEIRASRGAGSNQ